VLSRVELGDGQRVDRVRLAALVSGRAIDLDRLASPGRPGLVLPLRICDPGQCLESGAEPRRIRRPQLRKQRFVGLLGFAERAPLVQSPGLVERWQRALRRPRQEEDQAETDRADRHRSEIIAPAVGIRPATQGEASAGRTGATEPFSSFPLSPSIWTGTVAFTESTVAAPGTKSGKSSETSRETFVLEGSVTVAEATAEP